MTYKKLTCRTRCLRFLKNRAGVWVASGEMQRISQEKRTYTGATVARELRRLAEDGVIEVQQIKNHAHYRYPKRKLPVIDEHRRVVTIPE